MATWQESVNDWLKANPNATNTDIEKFTAGWGGQYDATKGAISFNNESVYAKPEWAGSVDSWLDANQGASWLDTQNAALSAGGVYDPYANAFYKGDQTYYAGDSDASKTYKQLLGRDATTKEQYDFGSKYGIGVDDTERGQAYKDLGYTNDLPEGFTTEPINWFSYTIKDPQGQSVGTGYYSQEDSLNRYQEENNWKTKVAETPAVEASIVGGGEYATSVNQQDAYWSNPMLETTVDMGDGQYKTEKVKFKTKEEAEKARDADRAINGEKYYLPSAQHLYGHNVNKGLAYNEAIGNILAGQDESNVYDTPFHQVALDNAMPSSPKTYTNPDGQAGNYINKSDPGINASLRSGGSYAMAGALPASFQSGAPVTKRVETIKGEHSLIGAKPVFVNGKFKGYEQDFSYLSPEEIAAKQGQTQGEDLFTNVSPNFESRKWDGGTEREGLGIKHTYGGYSSYGRAFNEGWDQYATPLGGGQAYIEAQNAANLPGWNNYGTTQDTSWTNHGFMPKIADTVIQGLFSYASPIAGAAYSAFRTGAQGGDIGDVVKNAAISYVGAEIAPAAGQHANSALAGSALATTLGTAGTATLSGALGSAAGTFSSALLQGADFKDALLAGAVGGLTQYAAQTGSSLTTDAIQGAGVDLSPVQLKAVDSAVSNFIKTGLKGGDLEQMAISSLTGGVGTLVSGGLGDIIKESSGLEGKELKLATQAVTGALGTVAGELMSKHRKGS